MEKISLHFGNIPCDPLFPWLKSYPGFYAFSNF
jgi:hypothetical protein